jgi:hypothetical protein
MNRFSFFPRLVARAVLLSLILIIMLSACSARATIQPATGIPPQPTARSIAIDSFHNLQSVFKEISTPEPEPSQALADELWQTLTSSHRVPWIQGTQVIFFYIGQAEKVNWRGSFNSWNAPGLTGNWLWPALINAGLARVSAYDFSFYAHDLSDLSIGCTKGQKHIFRHG